MTPAAQTAQTRGAFRDERGAMMVIGVFMAVFLTGVLYYLIGTAEAVFFREGMQDAADAAALGAAIGHARGMNFIALINLLMAALVTILLALKLIETLVTILMGVLTALAATGILAAGVGPVITALYNVRTGLSTVHEEAKAVIFPMLRGLSQVQNAVRVSTPAVAELLTIRDVVDGREPADFGFMLPTRMTLPVERDDFSVLCARAGGNIGQLALKPFGGAFSMVQGTIDGALTKLAGSLSAYFCGEAGSKPPSAEIPVKRAFPLTALGTQCVKASEAGKEDPPECTEAKAEGEQAAPDVFGNCRRACGPSELFEQWTSLARQQCNPEEHGRFESWKWQQMWVVEKLSWSDSAQAWQVDNTETTDERTLSGEQSPCGHSSIALGPTWSATRQAPEGASRPLPVCTEEQLDPPLLFPKKQIFTRRYRAVSDVFGCVRTVNATYTMGDAQRAQSSGDEVPWKVEAGVELGQEDFQIRTVALAGTGDLRSESGVRLATWTDCAGGRSALKQECQGNGLFKGTADLLGRLSVAQAEYYFEGQVKREEWLWNMNWRARLKRFRLPETKSPKANAGPSEAEIEQFGGQKPASTSEAACGRAKGAAANRCNDMSSTLQTLSAVIKH